MKRSTISSFGAVVLIISSVVQAGESSAASSPRITALALQPSQFDASKNYSLLPKPEELTEGDAVALYNKAVADMPENMDVGRLRNWTRIPLSELPQDQVQTFLQQAQPAMQAIAEAAVCRSCNWPPFQAGTMPASLSEYRNLAYLVYLKARLEIARKQYDDAVATIRTGLAMARHIGEAPTVVQGLVGVATAAVMLRAVDDLAQTPDSANLYGTLAALPRPLIDLEKPIASELKALESNPQYNALVRRALRKQMEESYVRVRQLGGRLDGDVAAHQCIQALRHYAATHDDQLPTELSDITGVELPNDPVTQKPFMYHLDGTKAVLEMGVPEGGRPSESMRYEITVVR
jgi:tetratricopeptide (TPR) repeat protein